MLQELADFLPIAEGPLGHEGRAGHRARPDGGQAAHLNPLLLSELGSSTPMAACLWVTRLNSAE